MIDAFLFFYWIDKGLLHIVRDCSTNFYRNYAYFIVLFLRKNENLEASSVISNLTSPRHFAANIYGDDAKKIRSK